MNTLSVLLPLYNAYESLERAADELLEILPEMAGQFELNLLDDGSLDDSVEVASELSARYPQVGLIRHPVRLGLAESIQSGFDHIRGDLLLVSDSAYKLEPDDLRTLWQLREASAPLAKSWIARTAKGPIDLRKALAWKSAHGGRGLQLIDRKAFDSLRLRQSLAAIARIDRANRTLGNSTGPRPNYLDRSRRFTAPQ